MSLSCLKPFVTLQRVKFKCMSWKGLWNLTYASDTSSTMSCPSFPEYHACLNCKHYAISDLYVLTWSALLHNLPYKFYNITHLIPWKSRFKPRHSGSRLYVLTHTALLVSHCLNYITTLWKAIWYSSWVRALQTELVSNQSFATS